MPVETGNVTAAEAAFYKKSESSGGQEIAHGSDRLTKLAEIIARKKPADAREGFDYLRNPPPENDTTVSREAYKFFGGGISKKDESGAWDPSAGTHPEAERSVEQAETAFEKVSDYLRYSEIPYPLPTDPGEKDSILEMHGFKSLSDFNALRKRVLDSLADLNGLQAVKFIRDDVERRDIIELNLASDPSLRKKVGEAMHKVAKEAKKLSEEKVDDPAMEAAKRKETEAKELREQRFKVVDTLLDYRDVKDPTRGNIVTEIEKQMRTGSEADVTGALNIIRTEIINSDPDLKAVDDFTRCDQEIARLNTEITAAKLSGNATEVTRLGKLLTAENLKRPGLESSFNGLPSGTEQRYKTLIEDTSDATTGGEYTSAYGIQLAKANEAQKTIMEAGLQVALLDTEHGRLEDALSTKKLTGEAGLIKDAEAILQNSLVGLFEERAKQLTEANKELSQREQNQFYRDMLDKMNTQWVKMDTTSRKRIPDRAAIQRDMHFLIYNPDGGQDALKRLMLRDMNMEVRLSDGRVARAGEEVKYTDRNGVTHAVDAYTDPNILDLANLTNEQKAQLEHATKTYGSKYQQTLMSGFYESRNFGDRHFGGDLGLSNHEWAQLSKDFGGVENIRKMSALGEEAKGKKIAQALQNAGIIPKSARGIFLAGLILAALVGGVALATPFGLVGAGLTGVAGVTMGEGARRSGVGSRR